MSEKKRWILVTGATGRQGGAVVRHLLKRGWGVRGLTRNPDKPKAKALSELGAQMVKGDLNDEKKIRYFFEGIWGVFSVQNPWISGLEKEVEHGVRVARLSRECNVSHLIYSSAGPGKPGTGVPHFESKVAIEKAVRESDVPYTILRPAGFMEMMTDRDFFPELVAWNVTSKVMGSDFPMSWIACDDIGAVAAEIFSSPESFIGRDVPISGDVKSMRECLEIYRSVFNRNPKRIPVPVWLFRLMQKDLYRMYSWMKQSSSAGEEVVWQTRVIHPETKSVKEWMLIVKKQVKRREEAVME